MPRIRTFAISFLLLVIPVLQGLGQTCCSGGVPMSGNLGLPAEAQGTLQLALNYDANVLKTLKFENQSLNDDTRQRITQSLLIEAGYSLTQRISVDALFSVVEQTRKVITPNATNSASTRGLGDAVLLVKYRLTPADIKTMALLGIGTKLATGKHNFRNDQGIQYAADLQPGSGATDLVLWGSFSTPMPFRPSLNLILTSVYRSTGENKNYLGQQTYEFGDEVQIMLGLSDRINIRTLLLDPSISARYRYAGEDFVDFNAIPNTGGNWIFLVPSLSMPITDNFSINGAVDIPLLGKPFGTQLSPSFRANAGIFYRINSEKTLDL